MVHSTDPLDEQRKIIEESQTLYKILIQDARQLLVDILLDIRQDTYYFILLKLFCFLLLFE